MDIKGVKGWVMFKRTGSKGRSYGKQRHFVNGLISLCGQLAIFNDDLKYIVIVEKSSITEKRICKNCLRRIDYGITERFNL